MSPRVGSFGDRIAYTPNLDRIAAKAIRYGFKESEIATFDPGE